MFGGDWLGQPSEKFTVGEDSTWTDLGKIAGQYPSAFTINNEVYLKGKFNNFIKRFLVFHRSYV